jgi:hypothetical protein
MDHLLFIKVSLSKMNVNLKPVAPETAGTHNTVRYGTT